MNTHIVYDVPQSQWIFDAFYSFSGKTLIALFLIGIVALILSILNKPQVKYLYAFMKLGILITLFEIFNLFN